MGVAQNIVSHCTSERNNSVRVLWGLQMAHYTVPDMLVSFDESAVDGQSGLWANGWSTADVPAVARTTLFRGARHSTFALTSQGMISLEIFYGSVPKAVSFGLYTTVLQ